MFVASLVAALAASLVASRVQRPTDALQIEPEHTSTLHSVERTRESERISMGIDLEVLSSFDLIITTSTSDSDCV